MGLAATTLDARQRTYIHLGAPTYTYVPKTTYTYVFHGDWITRLPARLTSSTEDWAAQSHLITQIVSRTAGHSCNDRDRLQTLLLGIDGPTRIN